MLSGTVTLVKLVQPLNACASIFLTPSGITSSDTSSLFKYKFPAYDNGFE